MGASSQRLLELPSPRPLFPVSPGSRGRQGAVWLTRLIPLPHQDLVFDLGDPVRWEYMLLGTDKPHLSLTEEEEEDVNDEEDLEGLVSLRGAGRGGGVWGRALPPWLPRPHSGGAVDP